MSRRYYQDSKIFVWLRYKVFKIDKPVALPWGGWEIWDKELKASRPIAYFFTETLPDVLEKPGEWFIDPIDNACYYLRNRFVNKTHYLHTDLKPGKWHEFESRLLHGMFTEFVDFVEIEQAYHSISWNSEEEQKKYKLPWWRNTSWFRWKRWRSAEAAMNHQKWSMTLDDPAGDPNVMCAPQAESAREIVILYTWWKEVRPNRKEEWDAVGLREFWTKMDEKHGDSWLLGNGTGKGKLSNDERLEYDRLSAAVNALEEARTKEDEDMMIRLIKLRKTLWT